MMVAIKYNLLKIIAFMCMLMIGRVIGEGDEVKEKTIYVNSQLFGHIASYCKTWITEEGSDEKLAESGYKRCEEDCNVLSFTMQENKKYFVHGKVWFNFQQTKVRGSFEIGDDVCVSFSGSTAKYNFNTFKDSDNAVMLQKCISNRPCGVGG
ncbi:hypothetical protein Glove_94g45 [Diversispora epigaea]|uniref:Uncharacterized protein n=1 Tax=Diversispora epigaea TaxID=1348612 RepID=A0A397J8P0_9GLOM|nr:hypothetical protein Glove_94g45 [Diversispora epigaea]